MGYNIPTYTPNNLSMGPAVVFVGAAGSTPSTDLGLITEAGVTIKTTSTKRQIRAGNPLKAVDAIATDVRVTMEVTGREWNQEHFIKTMGAGVTTSDASEDTWDFGGDPTMDKFAIHARHAMAVSGQTMNAYFWYATGAQNEMPLVLGPNEHEFSYMFEALHTTTDWAGNTLDIAGRMWRLHRQKT